MNKLGHPWNVKISYFIIFLFFAFRAWELLYLTFIIENDMTRK